MSYQGVFLLPMLCNIAGEDVEFGVYQGFRDLFSCTLNGSICGEMKEFLMEVDIEMGTNNFLFQGENIPQELLDKESEISDAIWAVLKQSFLPDESSSPSSFKNWLLSNGIKEEELTSIEDKDYRRRQYSWDHVLPCEVLTEKEVNSQDFVAEQSCPLCIKENAQVCNVIWVKFKSPPWTWRMMCGREGNLAICIKHKVQFYFLCTRMN